jgi:hypothetical protein
MTLWSRPSRFALTSARSLPFLFVCHATAPSAEASYLAAFDGSGNSARHCAGLININRLHVTR